MAQVTSGIVKSNTLYYSTFYVSWNRASYDVAKNTSTINWEAGLITSNGVYWLSNAVKINSVYINGSLVLSNQTYSNISGNGTHKLASGSITINHNADGNKSFGISISGWLYDTGSPYGEGAFELPTIPRASSVSGGSGNIGSATTINISRASSSFTHTLEYSFGSLTGTIATGVGTSYNWTIPTSFYAQIPNSNSGTGTITCKTYSGSTLIGTSTVSFTAKVINSNPTFTASNITYADTNTTVTAITGNNQHIVQNKSNLKVTYTKATGKNSATISSYKFVLNGVTKTSTSAGGTIDFGAINSASNLTLTVTVTDSRGNTTSATKTITMLAHSNPTAIVTLERLNNYEDETYLTVDGAIASVNGKNAMTIKYRYKVSGGSYGSYTTISDNVKQTLSLNKNNQYVFNIVVTDSFGATYNKEHILGKGTFPLFIDVEKNSVGINALPRTNNVLEIAGRIIESEKEFSIPVNIGTTTGWYLAMSGSFSYTTNKVFLISIQQVFSGGAGLLYLNMRKDDNGLKIQRFEWLSQNGIASSNIKVKIDGSSFNLYIKTTANYQQYYLKVIQEKELGGWGFQQYKMYSPLVADTVAEPTGTSPTDFIQTTSTNDGTVIKYPDGTMVINQKYNTTVTSSNWSAWGSMYTAKLNTPPNFPVAFVGNKPTVIQTLETDSANASLCTSSEGTSISSLTRAGASQVIRPTNPGSNAVFTVHITATGRWK